MIQLDSYTSENGHQLFDICGLHSLSHEAYSILLPEQMLLKLKG
jgi:hypothetical protein